MNVKSKLSSKLLLSLLFASLYLNFGSTCASALEKNESENFNFIKTEGESNNFVYDGSLLLYGGIGLISISIAGMTFTLLPNKRKSKDKRKNQNNNIK